MRAVFFLPFLRNISLVGLSKAGAPLDPGLMAGALIKIENFVFFSIALTQSI